jgi:hypothetical protein
MVSYIITPCSILVIITIKKSYINEIAKCFPWNSYVIYGSRAIELKQSSPAPMSTTLLLSTSVGYTSWCSIT